MTYISRRRYTPNSGDQHGGGANKDDVGGEVSKCHRPVLILHIPLCTQTFDRSVNMLSWVKLVDRVFDILQYFGLLRKLFGPVRIEVEAERIKM